MSGILNIAVISVGFSLAKKTFCSYPSTKAVAGHRPGVLVPHAQLPKHLHGGHLSVEGVEVEAWHLTTLQQYTAHAHRLLYAIVADGSVIVLDGLDDPCDLLWDLQLGQLH